MSWNVYEIDPVDHDWDYLPSVESVAKNLAATQVEMVLNYGKAIFARLSYEDFLECWASAQNEAKENGWAGDHREVPRVLWFPIDDAFHPGFVIKQDSNGLTYVISPVALPHLEMQAF